MQLVADVGGTKTLLGLAQDGEPQQVRRYENDDAPTFHALLEDYLRELPPPDRARIDAACFALAAPVTGADPVRLTNRANWQFDSAQLRALLHGAEVLLVNDFAAAAKGLAGLRAADLTTLQRGAGNTRGLQLCVGPGTGFGVAALDRETVLVSEGGHGGFAAIDGQQADLWRFLGGEHRRVTIERVCSGPGLLAIYRYCLIRSGQALPPEIEAAEVVRRAREEHEPGALQAIRLFARILGAAAGDLALTFLARGGVYLAGGIAPRLLPELTSEFLRAFNDKAEHAALMRGMPVHVVLRADLPLLGAARFACGLTAGLIR